MLLYNEKNGYLSISNILILISLLFTLSAIIYPNLYMFGYNNYFLSRSDYHIYLIQFFSSVFLHAGFLHLFANSLFLYIFWNTVELLVWKRKYIWFFIFVAFFVWSWLTFVGVWNTVWISWFCMALLSYYTLELKSKNNIDYKWWITAIVVNIAIWIHPWISLFWHMFWAIAGIIFYILNKNFRQKIYNFLRIEW